MFGSNNSGSDQKESTIGIWIAIGAGLGVPVGLVLGNLALGIAVGVATGVAIGAAMDQRRGISLAGTEASSRWIRWILGGLALLLILAGVVLLVILQAR